MIAIVTDSSVGYSAEEISSRGVLSVVPLNYQLGPNFYEEYTAGHNGNYMQMMKQLSPCKTAQPTLNHFIRTFSSLAESGYEVICIVLDLAVCIFSLFDPDHGNRFSADIPYAADDRCIVRKTTVAMQFNKPFHQFSDVFDRRGSALFAALQNNFVRVHDQASAQCSFNSAASFSFISLRSTIRSTNPFFCKNSER